MTESKIPKLQGKTAVETGNQAEQLLITYLKGLGYKSFDRCDYKKILSWVRSGKDIAEWCQYSKEELIYFHRVRVVENIYDLPWCLDFFIWNKKLWPKGLAIEVKTQSVKGSVDEKLPFIVFSMHKLKRPSGLLITGSGFRDAAIQWVKSQQNDNFIIWRETHLLRTYVETGNLQKVIKIIVDQLSLSSFLKKTKVMYGTRASPRDTE